jgi:hypothetical protein
MGSSTVASLDAQLTHVAVRRRVSTPPARIAWALRAARAWLGPEIAPAPAGMHRHQASLRLRVSDSPSLVTFRKAAWIDIGPVRWTDGRCEAEVSWRASSFAPLFPVFSGTLVSRHGEPTITGWYAPPGGVLGRAADRALLHIAAEGTGRWLLAEIERAALAGSV